jgi:hypothetical protein
VNEPQSHVIPAQIGRFMPSIRRLVAALIGTTIFAAATVFASSNSAAAVDGRVPDGRTGNPTGEVSAYYWHGLNRDPDPGGLSNYMSFVNKDCRWGILDAGLRILESAESKNRWPSTSAKAGALYASLLNRPPDPGGLNTYINAINTRGLRWSTTAMQSSSEFRNRLDRVCAGRTSTNATVWPVGDALTQAMNIHNASDKLVWSCGVGLLVNTFAPIRALKDAPAIIKRNKLAASSAYKLVGGACYGALQMLSAADDLASLADYGRANNPVFLEADQRTYTNAIGRWCEQWIRVGPAVNEWSGYKANFRC